MLHARISFPSVEKSGRTEPMGQDSWQASEGHQQPLCPPDKCPQATCTPGVAAEQPYQCLEHGRRLLWQMFNFIKFLYILQSPALVSLLSRSLPGWLPPLKAPAPRLVSSSPGPLLQSHPGAQRAAELGLGSESSVQVSFPCGVNRCNRDAGSCQCPTLLAGS